MRINLDGTDKYDYKKCAEVYELYAYTNSGEANAADLNQTFSLGAKVRVKNFDGYFGEEQIDKNDIHYGWNLGSFFVSGYTDEVTGADGNKVFLKNVGDKVTLWFKLNQNINGLNGKENLSITADTEGYDQYFETPKTDSGKGVLIIRQRDYENVQHDPIIYTNYLEANATVGADTKVRLFEEGDYEIALDYQITKDKLFDQSSHYRIYFKFAVRNGNCMVYPLDAATGAELTNSSMTENGFTLDMAKSRYLDINVKREILTEGVDGLIEDTRFNKTVKDGDVFTDDGIYTITVSNKYTGQLTTKKIYVGTDLLLKAYMTTGLSIKEIKDLVSQGATIDEMGTIHVLTPISNDEQPLQPASQPTSSPERNNDNSAVERGSNTGEDNKEQKEPMKVNPLIIIILVLIVVVIMSGIIILKKHRAY